MVVVVAAAAAVVAVAVEQALKQCTPVQGSSTLGMLDITMVWANPRFFPSPRN